MKRVLRLHYRTMRGILTVALLFAECRLSAQEADAAFAQRLTRFFAQVSAQAPRGHGLPPESSLRDGLPETLPEGFHLDDRLSAEGFVPFEGFSGEAPLINDWDEIDGMRLPPVNLEDPVSVRAFDEYRRRSEAALAALRRKLREDHWARIPDGTRIRRRWNGAGQEFWDYPPGTAVLHRFTWRSAPELYELRLVRRRADGRWAFGIYAPRGKALVLVPRQEAVEISLAGFSRAVAVRVHPESCRNCHAMHGHNSYQWDDEEMVGPCGFGPANPRLVQEWARAYQARHGAAPFAP